MTNENSHPRFNGNVAWAHLRREQQNEIGEMILELIMCQNGQDFYDDKEPRLQRPFEAGWSMINHDLAELVNEHLQDRIPEMLGDNNHIPIPSLIGPVCRICGCSECDACPNNCGWVESDLCTKCTLEIQRQHKGGEYNGPRVSKTC